MSDSRLSALAERVDRLEREARWWRRIAGLGGVLVVAAGLLGQTPAAAPAKTLDAERFHVRDAAGNVRALSAPRPTGRPVSSFTARPA
jgi:hypothetical protein